MLSCLIRRERADTGSHLFTIIAISASYEVAPFLGYLDFFNLMLLGGRLAKRPLTLPSRPTSLAGPFFLNMGLAELST